MDSQQDQHCRLDGFENSYQLRRHFRFAEVVTIHRENRVQSRRAEEIAPVISPLTVPAIALVTALCTLTNTLIPIVNRYIKTV